MMLCLDAGNSRLKWGLAGSAGWVGKGVLEYAELDSLPGALPLPPLRIMACNVAGMGVAGRIERLAKALHTPLDWLISSASACGVRNGYARPEQLGADRWAALIGARQQQEGALLVVMAGTATTIDTLDAKGNFRGGVILPGLALMRETLAQRTADLPHALGRYQPFPTNTDDAITSGAIQATLGAMERQAMLTGKVLCLLSGGAAQELTPHLTLPHRVIDSLVLEGLAHAGKFPVK